MTFIIAEAGVNHNGDIQEAHRLVVAAKRCEANAVKFQYFDSRRLWGDDRIKHLELSLKQMTMLKEQASSLGIEFMCTAFDVQGLEEILPLIKRIKISSGCITDRKLLNLAHDTGLPIIVSTGMATPDEIVAALDVLRDVVLLQCTSIYPCPPGFANLRAMQKYAFYDVEYGLSDHTTTVSIPIAAVAMGATVIEKHLTLDRNAEGPDHKASIEPDQFKLMVQGIREVEQAMGDGIKRVQPGETALREIWHARK